MKELIESEPYEARNDDQFINEMNELTKHHISGCEKYGKLFSGWQQDNRVENLPYIHVGLFKQKILKTEASHIKHGRTLNSSATSAQSPSQILLDEKSSLLQAQSSEKILRSVLGEEKRPLLILDNAKELRNRNISARISAALSLKPLSSTIHFLLENSGDPSSLKTETISSILAENDKVIIYGFTWVLWQAFQKISQDLPTQVKETQIDFVHSGGWKKLEAIKVEPAEFDQVMLKPCGKRSKVIDFYGLVEQVGIIYPLCSHGYRHVPVWAHCLVRDPYTLEVIYDKPGQLQLMNTISFGAPYHSVLAEDLAVMPTRACPCGIEGQRFQLLGRVPKAEIRGCSNV